MEKRQLKRSVPNFKTKALAVRKLKGKENCENERRETASFMYNFVQKTNATKLVPGPVSRRAPEKSFAPLSRQHLFFSLKRQNKHQWTWIHLLSLSKIVQSWLFEAFFSPTSARRGYGCCYRPSVVSKPICSGCSGYAYARAYSDTGYRSESGKLHAAEKAGTMMSFSLSLCCTRMKWR